MLIIHLKVKQVAFKVNLIVVEIYREYMTMFIKLLNLFRPGR
jgi:hypothetical protein